MSETYGFSEPLQREIVSLLLFDYQSFIVNMDIVQPKFFDNPILQIFVQVIYTFHAKYVRLPSPAEMLEETEVVMSGKKKFPQEQWATLLNEILFPPEDKDYGYLKDKVRDFARFQAAKSAILKSAEILQKKPDYAEIVDMIGKAVQIGENTEDLGDFYFKDTEARIQRRQDGQQRRYIAIPTGLDILDSRLGGGIAPGELGVIMGPAKRGKTTMAISFVKGALLAKKNVIHYGFEGSKDRTEALYDSSISGVDKDYLDDFRVEVQHAVDYFHTQAIGVGRLVVKHYPAQSCSARTMQAHIERLRFTENFIPDLIVVDYLGLMSSTKTLKIEASSGGKYYLLGEIAKELLSLGQRNNFAIWLLHQSTRGSGSKGVIDLDDSGDSFEPMRDADLIITLNQTKEEGDEEKFPGEQHMRAFVAGSRETKDRVTVHLLVNKGNCQIRVNPEKHT